MPPLTVNSIKPRVRKHGNRWYLHFWTCTLHGQLLPTSSKHDSLTAALNALEVRYRQGMVVKHASFSTLLNSSPSGTITRIYPADPKGCG